MPDTLRQLGKTIGQNIKTVEYLNKRGGYLPQVDRTRGNVLPTAGFISNFTIRTPTRKVALKLTFYKASIL